MGKIEGIKIENYGPLKNIIMGQTLSHRELPPLGNLTAIIGPSGTQGMGKSVEECGQSRKNEGRFPDPHGAYSVNARIAFKIRS